MPDSFTDGTRIVYNERINALTFQFQEGYTMRSFWLFAICFILIAGICTAAPFTGAEQFYEFRDISGLSGSGYGVNTQGYRSLSGPVALSTPVAPTLGHNQWQFEIGKLSNTNSFAWGNYHTNGTMYATWGNTYRNINIAVSEMILDSHGAQSTNLQAQLIPNPGSKWSFSLGVQELFGANKSAGNNAPGDQRSSRSVFGVATYKIFGGGHALYVSAGGGTRRYKNGFASVSYRLIPNIRYYAEFDGWVINQGLVFAHLFGEHGRYSVDAHAGFTDGKYPTIGFGVGF